MNHFYFRIIGFFWIIFPYQGNFLAAQSTLSDSIYTVVDSLPTFPGGVEKMTFFVKSSLPKYVETYIAKGKEFDFYQLPILVRFVVEKDGSLTSITALPGSDSTLVSVAVRIVQKMPKWTPGKRDGQIVRTWLTIPVSFYLNIPATKIKSNGIDTEEGGFLVGINFLTSSLGSKLGNHLEQEFGLTLDVTTFGDVSEYGFGSGFYYTYLQTSVVKPFERRQGVWNVGRSSNLNEIGLKYSYRFTRNRRIEFFPTLQLGAIWHQPAKKYFEDSGLGMGSIGFSMGFGLNLFWFINETANDNYNIIQITLHRQQIFMASPLKGSIISLGIGYAFMGT